MSVSHTHRLIRLLQYLQSGRECGVDGLAEALNVSRRSVFRDLNILKAAGVPVSFSKRSRRYSIGRDYFLPPINLSVAEALALLLVTHKVLNRDVHPDYARAVEAAMKIEGAIPSPVREHCGELLDKIDVLVTPTTPAQGVRDVMGTIQGALVRRRKIQIRYDSFTERDAIDVVFHPYRLTFVSRAWYAIGWSELHKAVRTFKLERVMEARLLDDAYTPDDRFDIQDYFGNAWQMIREDNRYHVKIRFLAKVAGNVEEVLWHKTQHITWEPEGSLIFEVDVDGLREISWWILGYGNQAVVLEPERLREMILDHARRTIANYEGATMAT